MALSAVKTTLERALDKDLSDLVRGIRAHKDNEAKYINECLDEIKDELKTGNIASKANAVNKLAYLQMLGYDISWSAFNIIEVMSSPKFSYKRIGYLAASQCFGEQTDVLMLATNLIRKDLSSGKLYDTSIALSGLSCFVTPDLAKDLCDDILALTMSPKPYIAKKAILLMYKVFLKNPDALRTAFPRLRKKLEDPDPDVQSAAVNVICELARKNPKNYLSLSPVFFKLMTTSTNNWVLIKIIKLFGALTPLEPRLGKKLIEPLTNLIHNTSAMSLLYECINTVLAGVPDHHASIQLCVQKLRILIEDSDQNLKYLGLLAMGKILRHHPKSVQAHKDLILACLDDRDESIRLRALDLLHGMVSRANLLEIVRSLVRHLNAPEIGAHFRAELIATVVRICSQGNYQYILSFEWYISVLIELAQLNIGRNGELLANQLLDVAVRVASVRPFAVSQMAIFLRSYKGMITHSNQSSLHDIIYAAAWICGEYAGFLEEPRQTLEAMLETASLVDLRGHIQSVLVLNSLKLYCKLAAKWFGEVTGGCAVESSLLHPCTSQLPLSGLQNLLERLLELTNFLMDKISLLVHSANLEVQERAVSIHQLLHLMAKRQSKLRANCGTPTTKPSATLEGDKLVAEGTEEQLDTLRAVPEPTPLSGLHALLYELSSLFEGELNPVAPKAQRKVPIPEGLDLDAWINEPPASPPQPFASLSTLFPQESKSKKQKRDKKQVSNDIRASADGIFTGLVDPEGPKPVQFSQVELDEIRKQRLQMQESNPHYLKSSKSISHTLVSKGDPTSSTAPSPSGTTATESSVGLKLASSDKLEIEVKNQFREMNKTKKRTSGSHPKTSKKGRLPKETLPEQRENEGANEFPTGVAVSNVMDLPEGVAPNELDSPEETDLDPTDPHRFLNIQLDIPVSEPKAVIASVSANTVKKRKARTGTNARERLNKPPDVHSEIQREEHERISEEAFLQLLAGSTLTASHRAKVRCPATAGVVKGSNPTSLEKVFLSLLQDISAHTTASVIERVGTSASLYLENAGTPVCILMKLSSQTGSVLVETKSTSQVPADNAAKQIKLRIKTLKL